MLAIDLFAGCFGWGAGLVAEGWRVVAFDIVDMCKEIGYPRTEGVDLVLQDVLTIHGKQFKDADLIVASPPCQFFSYCAMPWGRAKALAAEVRADPARLEKELALFRACFRIQREACEAAGRHIPMVVENVRGAEAWVGRAAAKYGSFYFWGDVPALMPVTTLRKVVPGNHLHLGGGNSFQRAGGNMAEKREVVRYAKIPGTKTVGHVNKRDGYSHTRYLTNQAETAGVKQSGLSGEAWFDHGAARHSSKSNARKAASAMIAKIPEPLARWIGHAWKPV